MAGWPKLPSVLKMKEPPPRVANSSKWADINSAVRGRIRL